VAPYGPAILVVDDQPGIRLVCRVNLELEGYAVEEASTIEEAAARLDGVALVLTDLKLSEDGDGVAFGRRLRRERPDVRLILMSGTTPAPSEPLDFADASFSKPFDIDTLIATVKRLAPL
jgi:DNA-binding NtrC family response regulator